MTIKEIKREYKLQRTQMKREYDKAFREKERAYNEAHKQAREEYKRERRALFAEYDKQCIIVEREYDSELREYYDVNGKPMPSEPPKRGLLEEIGNSVTHGVGAAFAIVAFMMMLFASNGPLHVVSASIYFFGMVVMFLVSCIYHAFPHGMAVKRLFRRFDYSCIYLLIGATFTPILLSYLENFTVGLVFFIIQWTVIIAGISLIGVFGPSRLRFIHFPLYFVLGWCGVMLLPEMVIRSDFLLFGCILGGGAVYSLGIIPFFMKKKVAHFIWHFFVLGGAIVQWIGIYAVIYLGA